MAPKRNLPTFTYTIRKKSKINKSILTTRTAICKPIHGKQFKPRLTFQHIFNPATKWTKSNKPIGFPKDLTWPNDIFKHALPKPTRRSRRIAKQDPASAPLPYPDCSGINCPAPKSSTCGCTVATWDARNTTAWYETNIELRHMSDSVGIGAIARHNIQEGTVIGEYTGDVIPLDTPTHDDRYFMRVMRGEQDLAIIDGIKFCSWVRFINHSCEANTGFEWRRVGDVARICVVACKRVRPGQQITTDYGEGYWVSMKMKGSFCRCEAKGCMFSG